ncbi:helix-turn-helix domain-containing protein [Rhodococcus sp. G-MC3]|uniref:winged helix-turn-helix transcriptional regulator n=1 Tax=Rhodococcus sp. G-MC3 TaxID=3046209 RepID=UPI0024BA1E45|nr:helix-turn-helix domain-containing protein [Rhodococcus sp. G-MC3]MDJ0396746.1 helix-turn-helix domain-containing protein [Rhodococcus sp. G-MC3]
MKSYNEFCSLARALDVIGDRWTMLVVRELLISPSRYSDLQKSLPGIATNLLAQRLRTLEEDGVVTYRDEPPPISARVYTLTDWGRSLRGPLVEIARWASPLMAAEAGDQQARGRWLVFAVMALYPDPADLAGNPDLPTITARIDADGDSILLIADATGIHATTAHSDAAAEIVVDGTSDQVFRTLSDAHTSLPRARITGPANAVRRFTQLSSLALTHSQRLGREMPRRS